MDEGVPASSFADEDLVRRWMGGEEDAFSLLYHRYHRPVLSTACRIIRDSEEARDATQEIFIKLYRFLPDWDPQKSRLSTWLYRLAANHAIDRWRLQRRRNRLEVNCESPDAWNGHPAWTDSGTGPYSNLARKEMAGEVHRLAGALPRLQRRFFALRYFYGFRLEEIARLEGRSIGTVKGLLFRACKLMRQRMKSRCWRTKVTVQSGFGAGATSRAN